MVILLADFSRTMLHMVFIAIIESFALKTNSASGSETEEILLMYTRKTMALRWILVGHHM